MTPGLLQIPRDAVPQRFPMLQEFVLYSDGSTCALTVCVSDHLRLHPFRAEFPQRGIAFANQDAFAPRADRQQLQQPRWKPTPPPEREESQHRADIPSAKMPRFLPGTQSGDREAELAQPGQVETDS